jgi:hypothetical protein
MLALLAAPLRTEHHTCMGALAVTLTVGELVPIGSFVELPSSFRYHW